MIKLPEVASDTKPVQPLRHTHTNMKHLKVTATTSSDEVFSSFTDASLELVNRKNNKQTTKHAAVNHNMCVCVCES